MAHARYGTKAPQWWKHLRDWKRIFWKRHRAAERREARAAERREARGGA